MCLPRIINLQVHKTPKNKHLNHLDGKEALEANISLASVSVLEILSLIFDRINLVPYYRIYMVEGVMKGLASQDHE